MFCCCLIAWCALICLRGLLEFYAVGVGGLVSVVLLVIVNSVGSLF